MATLSGTTYLTRALVMEVVSNPNTTPRYVVGGTSSAIGGSSGVGRTDEQAISGSFRTYGNGNTRLILGSATSRAMPVVLRALSPAQVTVLEALLGHTVLFLDTYGRRIYGAYTDLTKVAIPLSGKPEDNTLLYDVGFTLTQTTYVEGV